MSSAVTDVRFCPQVQDKFAVTCTDGTVTIYSTRKDSLEIKQESPSHQFDSLVLSCAWHPNLAGVMAVTLDTGDVSIVQWSGENGFADCAIIQDAILHHESRFSAHEAWVAVFSPRYATLEAESLGQPGMVYSGGDDAVLRAVKLPSHSKLSLEDDKGLLDAIVTMKGHDAGVTSILPIPNGAHPGREILITGSYDDHIRVMSTYDHRKPKQEQPMRIPTVLAELDLGGGVWKLKFMKDYASLPTPGHDEEIRYIVLASCMHAGAKVLGIVGSLRGEWNIKVLARFGEHKSMCYAADVQPRGVTGSKTDTCVSSSFYDRLLAVWKFEDK